MNTYYCKINAPDLGLNGMLTIKAESEEEAKLKVKAYLSAQYEIRGVVYTPGVTV